jgi:tetratricopeptide (TPR) repeat protein
MLLGTTANKTPLIGAEAFTIQLILQQRHAEAYELLLDQQTDQTAVLYNLALCLHWSGNYQEALKHLDQIQLTPQLNKGGQLQADNIYKQLRSKQDQTDDHLHGITEDYVKRFPASAYDAVIRLKTDCWLQLGNYTKVIALATPIAQKGYKNITDALKLAQTADDKRIRPN